ncbi:MAG TPA: hypothetical protein VFG30_23855 [Polyangiales bacterium]|nr:hypothetical protein [Polyangiales bacterium]
MFKSSEHRIACAILIALCAACGDDSGSSTNPTQTGGAGGAAGSATIPGTTAGSTAAGRSGTAGGAAGRGAAGSSVAGSSGRAGGGGSTAGTSAMSDDDAGVAGSTAAGSGAAGRAGSSGSAAGMGGAAAGSGGTGGTATAATFTEVYAIFMTSCAGSTCHVSATRPGDMLAMTDKATAYMNLVGVNSVSCSGEKRVVAGNPTASELVATLAHTRAGSCARTPMMPDNKPMLPADQIEKVRSWIMAGAMNN